MTNRSLPMMPWFPQDFAGATSGWSFGERAVYRELLDAQWTLGELPNDPQRLARIARMDLADFEAAWPLVKTKFRVVRKGKISVLLNERLEDHRLKAERLVDQRRAASEAAGQARRNRAIDRSVTARSPAPEHPSPSESPSPDKEKKTSSLRSEVKENGQQVDGSPEAPPTREPTATRLPKDFALSTEMRDYAASEQLDAERTFAQFKDFWAAASGAKARKHDWLATWRTWCRNQSDRNGNGRVMQGPRPTRYEQLFGKEDVVIEEPV